ncbi:1-acyl-sn-glycerol-3-phosphate acyltransferase [Candidatus Woesearchaeota archaeon]|nr:1-acyl-sn-glycerol-3-phosphate acyltransferase [Candidatus Woesearchaeota archaeon]
MVKNFTNKLLAKFFNLIFIKKIKGLQNIPKGGFVVAANHVSYLDVLLLGSVLYDNFSRYPRYLAKAKLKNDKHHSIAYSLFGTEENIPIYIDKSNPRTALDPAISLLKKGKVIAIFPEGGIMTDGKLHKGKTGAIRLASKANVPIIPLGISGTDVLMPRKKLVPKFKKSVIFNFGKPITVSKKLTKNQRHESIKRVMLKISERCNRKYEE